MLIMLLTLITTLLYPSTIQYTDSWGPQGFSLDETSDADIALIHSVTEFTMAEKLINNESRIVVNMPGVFLPNDEGAPNLPGSARYIAIPQGATASYTIVATRIESFQNVDIAPAPVIPIDSDDSPLVYTENEGIYSEDGFYPESPVIISEPSKIRGLDVILLGITPFQYNPVTKELLVYRDLSVVVNYEGGNGHFGEDRLRNRQWDRILKGLVINNTVLEDVDYKYDSDSSDSDFEYIIICPDDPTFIQYANQLKEFRTKQGIRSGVVTLSQIGGNTESAIENYINNAYYNWNIPPSSILLMADYGYEGTSGTIYAPKFSGIYSSCRSDNFYADVETWDNKGLPEITIARMTAQNEEHLNTMVSKIIDYETSPPTDPNFYFKPITACGWQTSRWFQVCSETIGGFMKNELMKIPTRINAVYLGNPDVDPWSTNVNTSQVLDYFGPNGLGYIPATPQELGGFTGGTGTDVINAINNGAFILQHRDHGYEKGWGEPDFTNDNINYLTNTNLSFIFSVNCLTGKFDYYEECFAEKFHRYTYNGSNAGAVGILAASDLSFSFVNDTYVWGMYDYLWPDFMPDYGMSATTNDEFMPAFASVSGKYFLDYSNWPYNPQSKEITNYLFHLHGDPYLTIYTEVPQQLTVEYDEIFEGKDNCLISADEGAIIALVANGEIIGKATGTGNMTPVNIIPQVEGTNITLTVTKQNYFRYEEDIIVESSAEIKGSKFAVLFAGDYNGTGIPAELLWNGGNGDNTEFWNDLFLQWKMLYNNGYEDENIFILFANGTDYWYDNGAHLNYTPEFVTGEEQFITDYSATKSNLKFVHDLLNVRMDTESFLYVWAMSHGGTSDQSSLYTLDGLMTDEQFAEYFYDLPANKKVYNISANYSGGFLNTLKADNSVVNVSAIKSTSYRADDRTERGVYIPGLENEMLDRIYYHGEVNFHNFISSYGETPLGLDSYNGIPLNTADLNLDDIVSVKESFENWADVKQSSDEMPIQSDDINIGVHTSIKYPTLIYDTYSKYLNYIKGVMAIPLDLNIVGNDLILPSGSNTTLFDNKMIVVGSGYTLRIQNDAILKINNGSKIIVEEGGQLLLEEGANIITEGYSYLAGDVNITSGSVIEINSDSELHIQMLSNIIFQTGSILKVNENSRFVIENGPDIVFESESSVEAMENAEIAVMNKGELVANGTTFSFTGTTGKWKGINCNGGDVSLNGVELYNAETGVKGDGSYRFDIVNSNFEGCINGIDLLGMPSTCEYLIENNTLVGIDEGRGIMITGADGSFTKNNVSHFGTGIYFVLCSPLVTRCEMTYNKFYGIVVSGHDAMPQLVNVNDQNSIYLGANCVFSKNAYQSNTSLFRSAHIGIIPAGNIYMRNNDVYSSPNFPAISIAQKDIRDQYITVDVQYNYWGYPEIEDDHFIGHPDYTIDYEPYYSAPSGSAQPDPSLMQSISTESRIISNALNLETKDKDVPAIKLYEHIIEKYVDTPEYYVAMARLPYLYEKAELDNNELITMYNEAFESEDTSHKKFFKGKKVATHIKGKRYDNAIVIAEEMKEEADNDEEILLTDINIGIANMLKDLENNGKGRSKYAENVRDLLLQLNKIEGKGETADIAGSMLPQSTNLYQNYPNPFNPVTTIKFDLAKTGSVKLTVFNINGQVVRELVNGKYNAGYHSVNFDASGLNSGLYFYRLDSGNRTYVKKMLLTK